MIYYAKLLLLGEHTINKGSGALAVPFRRFGGEWRFAPAGLASTRALQQDLEAFSHYLSQLVASGKLLASLDTGRFQTELAEGLYFHSDIPTGYGLGSSGALCAALYHRFSSLQVNAEDLDLLPELKRRLAQIESFFHGSSSGADPLICYLNRPVLMKAGAGIEPVTLPDPATGNLSLFLVDTGLKRQTGPLVQYFLSRFEDPVFTREAQEELIPSTDRAIGAMVAGDWPSLLDAWRRISRFQLVQLDRMIPPDFLPVWKEGESSRNFDLKLCGAGGGGYLLGITQDLQSAEEVLKEKGIKLLRVHLEDN